MPSRNKATKPARKSAAAKSLKPKSVSDKAAASVKGGRRDRLSANHNQTVRSA